MSSNWLKLISKVHITKHFLPNELLKLAIKPYFCVSKAFLKKFKFYLFFSLLQINIF